MCNFITLASLCSLVDRFESYLVENPEDKFSRDEAHIREHFSFTRPRIKKRSAKVAETMQASFICRDMTKPTV